MNGTLSTNAQRRILLFGREKDCAGIRSREFLKLSVRNELSTRRPDRNFRKQQISAGALELYADWSTESARETQTTENSKKRIKRKREIEKKQTKEKERKRKENGTARGAEKTEKKQGESMRRFWCSKRGRNVAQEYQSTEVISLLRRLIEIPR